MKKEDLQKLGQSFGLKSNLTEVFKLHNIRNN